MQTFHRLRVFCLAASIWSAAASGSGIYESVAIDENEQRLIQEANELGGYFNSQALLYKEPQVLELVRRVGHEIRPQPTDDYIEYEFFVMRDPSPNAFALPNGHVYVNTGMLARLRDEDQLAAVLAHEINHVAGHHSILDHRATRKKMVAGMVLGGLGGVGGIISIGLQTSVYGFARELEQEADNHAVDILRNSRYDPHALPELFDILGEDYEGLDPRTATIWSTHPELHARAQTSRALVASLPPRERHVEEFEPALFALRAMTIQDYIQDDYPHTAVALAESLAARYPDDPRLLALVGDAWQGMGARSAFDPATLTDSDKRQNLRERVRRTRAQRLAELLLTEEGRTAYAANLKQAEDTYQRVLVMDPGFAAAYRGLGEVYEQQGRPRDAAEAYLAYLKSAPDAADRPIVVGRLRVLTAKLRGDE